MDDERYFYVQAGNERIRVRRLTSWHEEPFAKNRARGSQGRTRAFQNMNAGGRMAFGTGKSADSAKKPG